MRWIKTSLILVLSCGFPQVFGETITVVPKPAEITYLRKTFTISQTTVITAGENCAELGKYMQSLLSPATAFPLRLEQGQNRKPAPSNSISLRLDPELQDCGSEGYVLSIKEDGIGIRATTSAGLFYGIQTLRQVLPPTIERATPVQAQAWKIPCVEIRDRPRFPWRGLMLDCSRTFWSKEYIKRTIRLMALYKLNRLHLHLTDDQGWRIEIKKYPKLTQLGAKFPEKYNEPPERQGFYSQADLKEIVEYGKQHQVSIVPEIEMPGHTLAVLACYPELSCKGGFFEIHPFFKGPGIHKDIFCAGKEETFAFLEGVLTEVIELFPFEFIHIGGDEAPKERWKACAKCQARIKEEGLKNEHELQSYFIKRMERFLNAKGKRLLGWDEIHEGGLAPNAAVMSWRGTRGGVAAAKAGHDVVMSPTSHCYFDYTYERISTMKAYSFEPVADTLGEKEAGFIRGAQANFWSHIDRTEDKVDQQLFPRLLSIAEVTWSSKARDEDCFRNRARAHLPRLKELGVNYYHDPSVMDQDSAQQGRESGEKSSP